MSKPTNDQRLAKSLQMKISNLRNEAAHLATLASEREREADQLQALIDEVTGKAGAMVAGIAQSVQSGAPVVRRRSRKPKNVDSGDIAPGTTPEVGELADLTPAEMDANLGTQQPF